ncbi:LacI family DNA-binding transcriptional regulator [Pseudonocardia halophobica]|uniref:LacI family transcriptional regulator n=1 Tax=Pseudonocardia halophobica TaxID=29401 RepID=A0A9W6UG38_9PSEU|nr:LacI family DNA-binding transcriptional regulator [Pseudonocardia halophobica]GLL15981.1 LacI family transcriptional regulator [Pseudonocardia halophobica]
MASIKDVARLAGVSLGTVSNVLNRPERVSPERRARVERAIEELGFVRSEPARQLRAGLSRTIAVVVLDVANPFFTDIIEGAEELAEQHDAQVVVCNSGGDPEREARHLDRLVQQQVLGILLSPVHEVVSAQLLAARRRHPPVVFVDRVPAAPGFASVAVDDVHGGALVGDLLSTTGHEHIAFAGGPMSLRQVVDRLHGLRSTFRGRRVDVVETPELTIRAGARVLDDLLARPARDRPTALFCANDLLAIGVLNACMRRRIAVPDELSVVGYDDIDFAETASVALTTVGQPGRRLGREAVELLLAEVGGVEAPAGSPRNLVFEPELVVRSSTRPSDVRLTAGPSAS